MLLGRLHPPLRERALAAGVDQQVAALEAELGRLRTEIADPAGDAAKRRELERDRLRLEARLTAERRRAELEAVAERDRARRLGEAAAASDLAAAAEAAETTRLDELRGRVAEIKAQLAKKADPASTVQDVAEELGRIEALRQEIVDAFEEERGQRKAAVHALHDGPIAAAAEIGPRDAEFETAAEYKKRIRVARKKIVKLRKKRTAALAGVDRSIRKEIARQVGTLDKQHAALRRRDFVLGGEGVTLELDHYVLHHRAYVVHARVSDLEMAAFVMPMPRAQAKEFRAQPDLIVPEVVIRATSAGPVYHRVVLHGPKAKERYVGELGVDMTPDKRFLVTADRTVVDRKTGLEWTQDAWSGSRGDQSLSQRCAPASIGGRRGWRAPTGKELATLIVGCSEERGCDYMKGPAKDGCYWTPHIWGECEWLSSSDIMDVGGLGNKQTSIDFTHGRDDLEWRNGYDHYRCVRPVDK